MGKSRKTNMAFDQLPSASPDTTLEHPPTPPYTCTKKYTTLRVYLNTKSNVVRKSYHPPPPLSFPSF